jgi:hypothetical protein
MRRLQAGTWTPHGILVLGVEGDRIARLDTYLEPGLVPAFEAT